MNNFKLFWMKSKILGKDVCIFSILFAAFILLAKVFNGHQGMPFIDDFTDVYLPTEILRGKLLYRDIFITYGPLSYQFTAFLFKIFGEKLGVYFAAGLANSLIVLTAIYLIVKNISSRWAAFTVTFMTMLICIFNYFDFNYVFPYSVSMTYAISTFLLSLLFCIYYIKTSNDKFITLALIFMGISLVIKIDFLLFLLVIAAILILKPVSMRCLLLSLLLSAVVPLISWGVLFVQGLTFSDLAAYFSIMGKMSSLPYVKQFYGAYMGLSFNKNYLIGYFTFFAKFIFMFLLSICCIYPVLSWINRFKKLSKILICGILITILSIICFFYRLTDLAFCWITVSTVFITLTVIFQKGIKGMDQRDRILVLIAFSSLAATARSICVVDLHSFGTYFLPLLLVTNLVFVYDYLPQYFGFLNKNAWIKACTIAFVSIAISFSLKYSYIVRINNAYPLITERGTIYTTKDFASVLNQSNDFIEKNIPEKASFLMIPQSPVLNFLANRRADGMLFELPPPKVEGFGEDYIIQILKRNPPDYIFINNRDTSDFGPSIFGKDYAIKLFAYIMHNYKFEKRIGKGFVVDIYKKVSSCNPDGYR